MAKRGRRSRFGEKGYTETDGRRDTEALCSIVYGGPSAIRDFYRERGGAPDTARALGVACKHVGVGAVRALLTHGARFESAPDGRYERMLLLGSDTFVQFASSHALPDRSRAAIAGLFAEYNTGDLPELLYEAILVRDFAVAERLLADGVRCSERRRAFLTGEGGYENLDLQITRMERKRHRSKVWGADDEALLRMLPLLHQFTDGRLMAVYPTDVLVTPPYGRKATRIGDRYRTADILPAMLKYTTLADIVTRRELAEAVAESSSTEALEWVISAGLLQRRQDIDLLMEVLSENTHASTEMRALALAHDAAHPRKSAAQGLSDPCSVTYLRKLWTYKQFIGNTIELVRYKGNGPNVVVPPRIGSKKVAWLDGDAFRCSENNSDACLDSISFPGTLRSVFTNLGPRWGGVDTKRVYLADGIQVIGMFAFDALSIEEITVPDSVQQIGKAAFRDCVHLQQARLPAGTRRIPDELFSGCTSLASLPDCPALEEIGTRAFERTGVQTADVSHVKQIGSYVFSGCRNLSAVRLPSDITEIPVGLFAGCTALEQIPHCPNLTTFRADAFRESGLREVHLGAGLREVEVYAFAYCQNLTAARLDSSEAGIAHSMFYHCRNLSDVALPAGLNEIGRYAFMKCESLQEIELPESLQKIGKQAFRESGITRIELRTGVELEPEVFVGCRNLRTVILEEGITALGRSTYAGCTSLESIELPETLEVIDAYAFSNSGLKHISVPESVRKIESGAFQQSALESVVIPGTVRCIEEGAFNSCQILREAVFEGGSGPEHVLRIEEDAFRESGLQKVRIPPWTEVGSHAFSECPDLREVQIARDTRFEPEAFSDCPSLVRVIFEDGAEEVPEKVCARCAGLRTVRFSDTVTRIRKGAFSQSGLRELQIPDTITVIESEAFMNSALRSVRVPGTVKSMGAGVFLCCCALEEVILDAGIESIPRGFLNGCRILSQIDLPETVRELGPFAFVDTALNAVHVPEGVETLGKYVFACCSDLEHVYLPTSITRIEANAFKMCSKLKQIVLPDALRVIGQGAFASCGLTAIQIPASVRIVEAGAFEECTRLERVEIENRKTCVVHTAFNGTPALEQGQAPVGVKLPARET